APSSDGGDLRKDLESLTKRDRILFPAFAARELSAFLYQAVKAQSAFRSRFFWKFRLRPALACLPVWVTHRSGPIANRGGDLHCLSQSISRLFERTQSPSYRFGEHAGERFGKN